MVISLMMDNSNKKEDTRPLKGQLCLICGHTQELCDCRPKMTFWFALGSDSNKNLNQKTNSNENAPD